MKINVIDLFAGCGGLTDGFLQTGKYNTLAAVDWEFPTVQTLKKRLSTKWNYDLDRNNILHFDIQRTDELINGFDDSKFGKSKGLDEIVGDKNVDLIVGGPPCQGFSYAGWRDPKDKRNSIYSLDAMLERKIEIVNIRLKE